MTRGQALTAVVLAHLAINIAHGRAHAGAQVPLSVAGALFVLSSSWRRRSSASVSGDGGRGSAGAIVAAVHGRRAPLRPHQSLHHRRIGSRRACRGRRGARSSASPLGCSWSCEAAGVGNRASGPPAEEGIMNVFIAGGTGAIGVPLMRALVAAGHQVTASTPLGGERADAAAARRHARHRRRARRRGAATRRRRRAADPRRPSADGAAERRGTKRARSGGDQPAADRRHAQPDRRGDRRRRDADRRRIVCADRRIGDADVPADVQAGSRGDSLDGVADSRGEPLGRASKASCCATACSTARRPRRRWR